MAAESKTVTATGTVSPKVFWPLVVGLGLSFLASFLAAVTPDMLAALGPFAVPMATALVSVASVLTAYLKRDELRDIGVEATAAVLAVPPTSEVVPPVVDFPEVDDAPDTAADELQAEVAQLQQEGRHVAQ